MKKRKIQVKADFQTTEKTESFKNYISFDYGRVILNGNKILVESYPLPEGRGFVKFEVLPAGTEIETTFCIPESSFTAKEFKSFLEKIGQNPIRGLSGASAMGWGHLMLMDFENVNL